MSIVKYKATQQENGLWGVIRMSSYIYLGKKDEPFDEGKMLWSHSIKAEDLEKEDALALEKQFNNEPTHTTTNPTAKLQGNTRS